VAKMDGIFHFDDWSGEETRRAAESSGHVNPTASPQKQRRHESFAIPSSRPERVALAEKILQIGTSGVVVAYRRRPQSWHRSCRIIPEQIRPALIAMPTEVVSCVSGRRRLFARFWRT